jgi:phage/plasmid-like protein (TIGR03299 family)
MAHNLHKNSMVYAGETPWHGLGVKLPANATWEKIAQLGGFYDVEKRDVQGRRGRVIAGKKALVRTDTNAPLAVVSDAYCVVQFSEVAQTIVEAAQGVDAIFHTAGLLGDEGSRGWLLAELPKVIRVKGDESEIRPYLLGTAAHDGHHGVVIKNVATRVVCQNTLGVAMGEDSKFNVSIHHTTNASKRLDEARKAFSLLVQGHGRVRGDGEPAGVAALHRPSDGAHHRRPAAPQA